MWLQVTASVSGTDVYSSGVPIDGVIPGDAKVYEVRQGLQRVTPMRWVDQHWPAKASTLSSTTQHSSTTASPHVVIQPQPLLSAIWYPLATAMPTANIGTSPAIAFRWRVPAWRSSCSSRVRPLIIWTSSNPKPMWWLPMLGVVRRIWGQTVGQLRRDLKFGRADGYGHRAVDTNL